MFRAILLGAVLIATPALAQAPRPVTSYKAPRAADGHPSLEGVWTNGLRTRLSYTFVDAENRTLNRNLPDSPEHLVKFNISVPLYKQKVFAGLEFQYTSRRQTVFTDLTGATVRGENARDAALVNFTLFSQNLIQNQPQILVRPHPAAQVL